MDRSYRPPAPVSGVLTVRDQYGHVARQTCVCGGNYVVYDEKIERCAEDSPELTHVLLARCLNTDCARPAAFRFLMSNELCVGGLGAALVSSLNPLDPARTFACIGVAQQITVGLVSMWTAARAAGVSADKLSALVVDATRHAGVPAEIAGEVARRLAAIGPLFDGVVGVLERESPAHLETPA